ncbi:MAG TPA: MarR family winged helix-turn-helix transcriptional regulator [Stellaceae bacterium]|jgi:DNA-binding MarR family transcriptional regulator|nr:MarR family winged helix-turn-helix transcriptional regulator [Stellaceae bacterium]
MSRREELSHDATHQIRDTCLCVRVQRAARALARHFDDALRDAGLTHGQFSLLVALSHDAPPTLGEVSAALAMDRTTLTANLKPLARRGLVKVAVDKADKRSRRLIITAAGRGRLNAAFPAWKAAHAELDATLGLARVDRLRADLKTIAEPRVAAAEKAAAE